MVSIKIKNDQQIQEKSSVTTLYDSPEGELAPMLFGGHIHWGYWDENNYNDDFASGAEKLTEVMISKTQIKSGQRFIDLGCGAGLAAMKLACSKNCYVDGITISHFQQRSAIATAKTQNLLKKVNFIQGDACKLPYSNSIFDGGWFFESIFHMSHKKALLEAYRVLKSGATLNLTDLPLLSHATDEFKKYAKKHIFSSFISLQDYPFLMQETGFQLLEINDITDKVMPQLVNKLNQTIEKHRHQINKKILGDREKAIRNWLNLFKYMSENLGYILVTAKKK